MVDSVKNYGIAGASTTIELGRQGAVIDASDSAIINLKDKDGALESIAIGQGTDATHAVTQNQLDGAIAQKLQYIKTSVNYNSGTVAIGTVAANTRVQSVVVEKGAGNWTDHNDTTEIVVGDSGDTDRLFNGFDPYGGQFKFENDHLYESETAISAIVTQGGASAGTADVVVYYTGTIS
jgi:hypothetical protein